MAMADDLRAYLEGHVVRGSDPIRIGGDDDPVAGRSGLVGTQNIRNNESRESGLDYVVSNGTIIEAVDSQPWSGEANVQVSIVNWVKHSPISDRFTERETNTVRSSLLIPAKRKLWFKVHSKQGSLRRRANR